MEDIGLGGFTRRQLKSLVTDAEKSAAAINLIYVSDGDKGISRVKSKDGFRYVMEDKTVTDKDILARIKSLVIPPAWENVWICKHENGHLQVTGTDVKGRKQYKYHSLWTKVRNHTKFFNLYEFGKALPIMRSRLEKDLHHKDFSLEKVMALIVSVMQETGIRIGNGTYEKLYGSFGLSTLKNRHVSINGSSVKFSFKGKKGVYQDLALKSKKLARLMKQCKDIPGKELFQYYDESGNKHAVDSGMVNNYIREISGGHFTAKDFRTWTGTVQALAAFKELGCADTVTETKHKIVEMLDTVALRLGNTRTVCKKYYVHPTIIDLYECRAIEKHLKILIDQDNLKIMDGLSAEESVLMKILSKS